MGSHSLKFGGDVRRQQFNQFLYYNINGDFSFQSGGANNSPGGVNSYPDFFLGTPTSYSQGAGQGEYIRNTSLYLFAQDSWKIRSNVTLNYGLRWELNTPYIDTQNRLQTFRPGQDTTLYPCWLSQTGADTINNAAGAGTVAPGNCSPTSTQRAYFPTGLVFPGDKGVPQGLTSTYYKAIAPRIGLAYSPNWSDGVLGAIAVAPENLPSAAVSGSFTTRSNNWLWSNLVPSLLLASARSHPARCSTRHSFCRMAPSCRTTAAA